MGDGIQGLDYAAPDASAIEERNALALAIVPADLGGIVFFLFKLRKSSYHIN